jgi:hypothetical protein
MPFFSPVIASSKAVSRIDTADLMYYYNPVNKSSYPGTGIKLSSIYSPPSALYLRNGVTYNTGGWLEYDGVNDYTNGSGMHDTTVTGECTVCVWMNTTSAPVGNQYVYLGNNIYGNQAPGVWLQVGNYSGVGLEIRASYSRSGGVSLVRIQGSQYASTGIWRFTAFRYTSSGTATVTAYNSSTGNLDSVSQSSTPGTGSVHAVSIGGFSYNPGTYNGKIGEVFAYNKALTNTELQEAFDRTKERYGY